VSEKKAKAATTMQTRNKIFIHNFLGFCGAFLAKNIKELR